MIKRITSLLFMGSCRCTTCDCCDDAVATLAVALRSFDSTKNKWISHSQRPFLFHAFFLCFASMRSWLFWYCTRLYDDVMHRIFTYNDAKRCTCSSDNTMYRIWSYHDAIFLEALLSLRIWREIANETITHSITWISVSFTDVRFPNSAAVSYWERS